LAEPWIGFNGLEQGPASLGSEFFAEHGGGGVPRIEFGEFTVILIVVIPGE
jgi:hypothetical protein